LQFIHMLIQVVCVLGESVGARSVVLPYDKDVLVRVRYVAV